MIELRLSMISGNKTGGSLSMMSGNRTGSGTSSGGVCPESIRSVPDNEKTASSDTQ